MAPVYMKQSEVEYYIVRTIYEGDIGNKILDVRCC